MRLRPSRPTGRGRHVRGRLPATVLAIVPHPHQVRDRLVVIGILALLVGVVVAPVTISPGLADRAQDDLSVYGGYVDVLVRDTRAAALRFGGSGLGFAVMIVVELIGTVAAVAGGIRWAERRHRRPIRLSRRRVAEPPGRGLSAVIRALRLSRGSEFGARRKR